MTLGSGYPKGLLCLICWFPWPLAPDASASVPDGKRTSVALLVGFPDAGIVGPWQPCGGRWYGGWPLAPGVGTMRWRFAIDGPWLRMPNGLVVSYWLLSVLLYMI